MIPHITMAPLDFGLDRINVPDKVIIHAMAEKIRYEGKVYHAIDWLRKLKLSVHILVDPFGEIYRSRNNNQVAYHAKGFNIDTVGLEILVPGEHDYYSFLEAIRKPYMSEVQTEMVAWQMQNWRDEYQFSISDFFRHSDLSPERKVDPGKGCDWGSLLARLNA